LRRFALAEERQKIERASVTLEQKLDDLEALMLSDDLGSRSAGRRRAG
jgi:hypothetical protein